MASQMAMGNMSPPKRGRRGPPRRDVPLRGRQTGPRAGRGGPEETGWAEPGLELATISGEPPRMKGVRAVPPEGGTYPPKGYRSGWEGKKEEAQGERRAVL